MKKCYPIGIVLILILMTLGGCVSDPATYYFDSDELIDTTVKIELAWYNDGMPSLIEIGGENITSFDYDKIKLIDDLDKTYFEGFITKLSSITFHKENYSANKPVGKTLILHQENGNMIVISCTVIDGTGYSFVSVFDSNDTYIAHIAQFADRPKFESLLAEYFLKK